MKVVILYEVAKDGLPKARLHFEARRARLDEFHGRGVLLVTGSFANPAEGANGLLRVKNPLRNCRRRPVRSYIQLIIISYQGEGIS